MSESTNKNKQHTFYGTGVEYQQQFKQWWSSARQSDEPPTPCDFLLNLGASSEVVKQALWLIFQQQCVEYPIRPGAIDYFVWHIYSQEEGGETFDASTFEEVVPFECDLESLPTDKLYDSSPDELTKQDALALAGLDYNYDWDEIFQYCMAYNQSADFMQALWEKIPETVRDGFSLSFDDTVFSNMFGQPGCRRALDHECVQMIQKSLPQLNWLRLKGKWTKEAFAKCINVLLQSTKLERLELSIPGFLDEEDSADPYDGPLPLARPQNNKGVCGVRKLVVDTITQNWERPWLGLGRLALDIIPQLQNLQTLKMSFSTLSLTDAVPCLVRLLKGDTTKLKHLSIQALVDADGKVKDAALDIMSALENNSMLEKLEYAESLPRNARGCSGGLLYAQKLLDVVQVKNVVLRTVALEQGSFGFQQRISMMSTHQQVSPMRKLEYYLLLNGNGRQMARDSKTATEFVALLRATDSQVSKGSGDGIVPRLSLIPKKVKERLLKLNINYGLLREMPGLWTNTALAGGRKRKRACLEIDNSG